MQPEEVCNPEAPSNVCGSKDGDGDGAPRKRSFDDMICSNVEPNPNLFIPRSYQEKVFQVALRRNTIVVLGTGLGKTMIAVMLINHIGHQAVLNSDTNKKLIFFLAPTVSLVNQQYQAIRDHTDLRVKEIYGALGVDEWTVRCWSKEISDHHVLVMTPQILLDALRNAFLTLETVSLIIFDECHRATGNHCYSKIMKEFYHKSFGKPKVFGMTASPVVKGLSSSVDCEDQISKLESLLDSQIYTIDDKHELEEFAPTATEIYRFYDSAKLIWSHLKERLLSSWLKCDALLVKQQESFPSHYRDMDEKLKKLQNRLSGDHAKVVYCLDNLGLLCAHEAVKVCVENVPNVMEECEFSINGASICKSFHEDVLCAIEEFLPQGNEMNLGPGSNLHAVDMGYISSKLNELLQVFELFRDGNQVLCLIFVERIVSAKVIERILKKVPSLSRFTVSYLTGTSSSVDALAPKLQKQTLESFRKGKVNLLFATEVIEEGIHVPDCSCVIRFDLPRTVRSYMQSRGRARQNESQFIMMLERSNKKQRDQLFDIIRSEYSMTDAAMNRDPDSYVLKACDFRELDAYIVEATGASVTTNSSVSLIHQYCEKLPRDKYYTPRPIFVFLSSGGFYECKLTLPPSAAFDTIIGPPSKNCHSSKQLVCLEACKKLHQMGALDDHLLPLVEGQEEIDLKTKNSQSAAGAGTTKRKELHGTTHIRALSGTWTDKHHNARFQAYRIEFSCNIASEIYSSFVLLTESTLDDDIANAQVDLYLLSKKVVKSSVFSCGEIFLDQDQITRAMCFHELFFNGLFGKLFQGSRASGTEREFILQKENNLLWNPSYMYLILPLESSNILNHQSWRINWKGIDSCVSVVEFLKKSSTLSAEYSQRRNRSITTGDAISEDEECSGMGIIYLANTAVCMSKLKSTVVMAIHTGRMYTVLDVVANSSSESPFDANADSRTTSYSSFADYFHKKYGIMLSYPAQPLLLLKQSHYPYNLLMDFNVEEGSKMVAGKPRNHVHMPPELLASIDVPVSVLKAFYLLPSLMHRLESLMLASQLRKEIALSSRDFYIPSSLILEALTTLTCCEKFSFERLELLGDSVLKYAVSCYLFLKHPKKHEGQLSGQRSFAVCNATLHKLGTNRGLQNYIRDSAFEPRRWVAPGQLSIRPVPCSHGVDTLDVPLDSRFQTTEENVMIGKNCDRGHRWMTSKTVADCVEALIGAYYVGGGLRAALHVMKWLGIEAEIQHSYLEEVIREASVRPYLPKADDIRTIELKIGYDFHVKGLLLEAISHASEQEAGAGYCYQRLEFLGDSVLDVLITLYLYQNHSDVDPGELTDLRSASVNNENFAQVAVKRNLYQHLQHHSGLLATQIPEYVEWVTDVHFTPKTMQGKKGPKALGDLVESIAGALLIDTKLNLDEVWRIFKPLLSPIATPDNLELPPLRELNELCDSLGYFIKESCVNNDDMVRAELKLQLEDVLLIGEGLDRTRKAARGQAALRLLEDLEKRGISYARGASKRRKQDVQDVDHLCSADTTSTNIHPPDANTPVIGAINREKGGPRTSLYELCKRMQWPMPNFETTEHKSRSPIEFVQGSVKRKGFNSYTSKIALHIPEVGVIEMQGDARADKKSSLDSAALVMLYELQRQGRLIIGSS